MPFQRPEPCGRQVVGPAQHDCDPPPRQFRHQVIGVGETARVAQQDADVVQGHPRILHAVPGDGHEAAQAGQVPPFAGNLDDAADHLRPRARILDSPDLVHAHLAEALLLELARAVLLLPDVLVV